MRSLDWQDWSACTPNDADAFTVSKKPEPDEMARLWGICIKCPVVKECAQEALDSLPGVSGVRAGVYVPGRGSNRTAARRRLEHRAGVA